VVVGGSAKDDMRSRAARCVRGAVPLLKRPAIRLRNRRILLHLAWIVVILAVALTARSLWVAHAPADPTDGRHVDDTLFYHYSAAELAKGSSYVSPWTGANTAQWPPGYSFLLATLYRLFGTNVEVAWGANIVLGALTCVAVYAAGCLILGKRVGAPAGLLLAVFPGHIFFSSLILSETLFTFLVVVAMALILFAGQDKKRGALSAIPAGLVVGAAALTRGQGLFLIIVALLFWWLSTADWRRTLRWTAVLIVAALGVIIPWTVRNYVAMDSFVFISTNAGGNLYVGNNEEGNGRFIFGIDSWIAEEYADLPPTEQEVAVSNRALREGLEFMFTHPWEEVQLAGSKLRGLYEDDEDGLRWIHHPEVGSPVGSLDVMADVANGFYFGVLAVSAGGLAYWLGRRRSAVALPLLVVGVFTLGQLAFFTEPRFHLPMLPSLCLLAAVGLVWGAGQVRRLVARL
jgi:4-amino-4-deoxy-L-arabinose transferase-like glycosyltransferase